MSAPLPSTVEPLAAARAPSGFSSLKTLFIIVDSGMAIRNILRTDVYNVLRSCSNLRIVIFSPLMDPDFKKEVGGENVLFEPLQKWKAGPIVKTIRSFRKDVWSEKHNLARFREKRASRKGKLGRAIVHHLLLRNRSGNRIDEAVARLEDWERKLTPPLGTAYFEKYKPDLIFYSTIYSQNLCLELGARQRNIPTCAYIVSWDNPTTKGPFPVRPDRAIIWNEIMQQELLSYHEFRPEQLFISGPPQFDIYTHRSAYRSREEFFKKWKLDPAKKLISYTTGSSSLFPFEHETTELLYRKIRENAFKQPCQLLVRLHPKDNFSLYEQFAGQPGLALQYPGRQGKTDDTWNPTREDMYELGETIAYSDVMVNIASTITIEAACFDKPVVNLTFDGFTTRPYKQSCRRIYDFNHYRKIVETGGIKMAGNIEETVQLIQRYLDNPALEAEGRARIVREQCHRFDGQSGQRIGQYILELLRTQR